MSTMIEKVARVLCSEEPDGTDRRRGDDGRLYPAGVPHWKAHVEQARMVIEALRGPSDEMLKAMFDALMSAELPGRSVKEALLGIPPSQNDGDPRCLERAMFQAAIDEALKP